MTINRNHGIPNNEIFPGTKKGGIDKFLLGIVIGVVFLVIIVFFIVFSKPSQNYLPENSPENVAHNYIFALENEDYPRAYSYLSPTIEGYPEDIEEFTRRVNDSFFFDFDTVTSMQFETTYSSEETAIITVYQTTFSEGGLFGSSEYLRKFEMDLEFENGEWKIIDSENYFAWCWRLEDGCQ